MLLFQCNKCESGNLLQLEKNIKETTEDAQGEAISLEAVLQKLANLQEQVSDLETKLEEGNRMQKCETKVETKLDEVLPMAVQEGRKASPNEMVCAYKQYWHVMDPIVTYDFITSEFNAGVLNIETGTFTAVTSGYYMITFSATAGVEPGEYCNIWLYHSDYPVGESKWVTQSSSGNSGVLWDQGSRTVVKTAILLYFSCINANQDLTQVLYIQAGNTITLRVTDNSYGVNEILLCLYLLPAL